MKNIINRILWVLIGFMFSIGELLAQSPTHIDTRRKDPKPFTLDDILLYIVFPVLLFIGAVVARRYQMKIKEQKKLDEANSGK